MTEGLGEGSSFFGASAGAKMLAAPRNCPGFAEVGPALRVAFISCSTPVLGLPLTLLLSGVQAASAAIAPLNQTVASR